MAAVAQPAGQVTELLQNLKVDSQTKADDTVEVAANVDGNASDGSVDASVSLGMSDLSSPIIVYEGGIDTGMYCTPDGYAVPHGFYYGGYEFPVGDWDDYSHLIGIDGMDLGVYSENGSVIYQPAGYYYTQPIYNSYSPGTSIPANSQLYGSPVYSYPGYFYQPTSQGVHIIHPATPFNGEVPPNLAEPFILGGGSSNAVAIGNDVSVASMQGYPFTLVASPGPYGHNIIPINGPNTISQDALVSYEYPSENGSFSDATIVAEAMHVSPQPLPVPALHGQTLQAMAPVLTHVPSGQHPQVPAGAPAMPGALLRPYQSPPGMYSGLTAPGSGRGNFFESSGNGQSWVAVDKGKPWWQGYEAVCNGNDVLIEQNRGPRTIRTGSQEMTEGDLQLIRGPTGSFGTLGASTDNKEQYNRFDFPVNYENAKFFIIKSYSEDDIHKSIKYNVWASTPNGNKKLDTAYQEAQGRAENCPIFLFFSVNASGQFCGVAEMVGCVDFNKSMDFWQQDKWNGRFPVKWHVIKDVPNNQFRHIILDNNDNKPVTNSRDTQEVRFELGIEMLHIFKNYVFKTSILDDFEFYENRQKAMQEKKARQRSNQQPQQFLAYRGGNEFGHTHPQEGILLKSHYGGPKIDDIGDCSNKVKDFQLSRILPHGAACHEAFPEEDKSLSKVGGKRESLSAAGAEAENMKTCSESKDAIIGNGDCLKDSTAKK